MTRKLAQAHLCFPSFGDRTKDDIKLMAGVFAEQLDKAGMSVADAEKAFDHHMQNGKQFPTIADITGALKTTRCYRMDYGPLGFGALYHENHPYIRLQMRMNTDISGYAFDVSAIDAAELERDARHAPALEAQDDDEQPSITRRGGSFRRLEFGA